MRYNSPMNDTVTYPTLKIFKQHFGPKGDIFPFPRKTFTRIVNANRALNRGEDVVTAYGIQVARLIG